MRTAETGFIKVLNDLNWLIEELEKLTYRDTEVIDPEIFSCLIDVGIIYEYDYDVKEVNNLILKLRILKEKRIKELMMQCF